MLKIGHRGASGYAPENTLASFKKAVEIGVDGVELDVRITKDGELVVIHDAWVNRITNGWGRVSEKTLNELKQLDAGNGEKIPTLQEVLDLINRKVQVHIELKGKNTARPVAKIIEEYIKKKGWKYNDFFVSSFNHNELMIFKRKIPQIKIGALIVGVFIHYDRYIALGAYSINMWSKLVRKPVVENAHKRGLKVFVYTVNSEEEMERMKNLGVEGIFTNFPDRMKVK
jgi:glycerophosphoryl diester phosphodiesterase